jgi:hypothetical protein
MPVYRVDLLTQDPWSVLQWINDNVSKGGVVRKIAYQTRNGWYVKAVFKRQSDAEEYHRKWYPDEVAHSVEPFV